MKNKITIATENLVAYRRINMPLASLYKKAERRMDPIANSIYKMLVKGYQMSEGARVIADIETKRKEARARTIREAVDEFKEKHPKYGEVLEKLIQEKRKKKTTYLVYGRVGEEDLPQMAYISVLKELDPNLTTTQATTLYQSLSYVADKLEAKKKEGLERILIK